ncbi:hypothetical protein [Roseicyclus persicicus]|uniref:Uncharacterized protein n=1 Tax=Roseicyclus persicicus TaxID=2650661 RepID=A0A7X6JYN7_9RHOB|nr:hypothetical protein [Roseibacterium persicicum]NKX44684.1 hypothetical protein [Roseibacterium persicicum]
MSAPRTNVETQERRHKPVLTVLRALIGLAALVLVGFVALQIAGSDEVPEEGFSAPAATD